MSRAIIVFHDGALRADHPAVFAAPSDAERIFVWDSDLYQSRGWTLKRLLFLHECLSDIEGLSVLLGDTVSTIASLGAEQIFIAETPDPQWKAWIAQWRTQAEVTVVADHPLTDIPANTDMGRFFRFWNRAKRSVMSPTHAESPE